MASQHFDCSEGFGKIPNKRYLHFVATKALLATTVVKERFCGPYVPLFMKGRAMEDIKYTISCKPDGKDAGG